MRVHHINCGTMCPIGGRLMYGHHGDPALQRLVCHCLLIETDRDGLVLVDTGIGLKDVRQPRPRLSGLFLRMNRIQLDEEDTAARAIERLGFRIADVRHIVLTHLDFDHAGGIEDFPGATVHVLAGESSAARHDRDGAIGRRRYRPMQWDDRVRWQEYGAGGEAWFGFDAVRDLEGLPPEILLIPLFGHSWGHCGVAVEQPEGWLLHAGDAYFYAGEMDPDAPRCPPGLRAYQTLMEVDHKARVRNQHRLRDLVRQHGSEVAVFCAHDAAELAVLRAAPSPADCRIRRWRTPLGPSARARRP